MVANKIETKRQEMLEVAKTTLKKVAVSEQQKLTDESIDKIAEEVIGYFEVIPVEESGTEIKEEEEIRL